MKRVSYTGSLMIVMLLSGCWQTNSTNKNTNEQYGGIKTMTRQKTDSGLQYEVIQAGSGESPQTGKQVTVHYSGWLDNNGEPGTKFDSSVDRGQPFTFVIGVGQVIKGWDEGVMAMNVGEKRRLYIPADLGYGAYGAGSVIPPHASLIFDVELLKIQ